MSQPNIPPNSKTGVLFQDIKLYIEGVQVPYLAISISSSLGTVPQAFISVPPQVGLMEISRFYNPKVHVFFTDPVDGEDKVLFNGIVTSCNMSKSADGQAAITFNCAHKYQFLSDLLVDYSGWTADTTNYNANDATTKSTAPNSDYGIALALTGIFRDAKQTEGKLEVTQANVIADRTNKTSNASPAVLPANLANFQNRFVGMPGVLLNMWNQLKQGAFWTPEVNEVMIKMYVPLVEDGLQFFKRMSGHFYIENKIEADRVDPCVDKPGSSMADKPRVVPPCMKVFLRSSVQADIGVKLVKSVLEFSGELTDLLGVYNKFLHSIDYEMVFLNSPAEVLQNPDIDAAGYLVSKSKATYAADVIVKPQMPFYFAPRCNVLYPNMIRNVSVTQDDYGVPTRITLRNDEIVESAGRISTYYRGPASIREAIASFSGFTKKGPVDTSTGTEIRAGTRQAVDTTTFTSISPADVPNQNLQSTLGPSHGKVGKFEQGRGLKSERMIMPNWLKYYSHSQFKDKEGNTGWPDASDVFNYEAIKLLNAGWEKRYGVSNVALNPWQPASGLKAYQRLLISSVDYYYAMTMARSRSGTAETIFNPYIVVGYPMDILDSTPNHPSFHAYCTSVTHTITASSISTSVGFASAMTYTELANYYLPSIHPWLQYVLGLAESQSIVNYVTNPEVVVFNPTTDGSLIVTPDAKGVANLLYYTTLGVAAVSPIELYDFDTGTVLPVTARGPGLIPGSSDSVKGLNGGEVNPMLTGEGNLTLTYRPIETLELVKSRWAINFIDLTPGNYNTNVIRIRNEVLTDKAALEPGQSQWLKYEPAFEEAPEDSE
jgi:hypothetical protein